MTDRLNGVSPTFFVRQANRDSQRADMQRIVPGITAVVLSDDRRRILLHLRSDNLLWSLPGGSAEFGEKIRDLIFREVMEETGIHIRIVRPFAIYSSPDFIMRYPDGNEVHSYVLGVECRKIGGDERSHGKDSLEAKWFDLESLPDTIMQMQYQIIEDALAEREFFLE